MVWAADGGMPGWCGGLRAGRVQWIEGSDEGAWPMYEEGRQSARSTCRDLASFVRSEIGNWWSALKSDLECSVREDLFKWADTFGILQSSFCFLKGSRARQTELFHSVKESRRGGPRQATIAV